MKLLWVNTIGTISNAHVMMMKCFSFWLKKLTLNNYVVISQFLCRIFCLSTLKNLIHKLYLWHNDILIYQMIFQDARTTVIHLLLIIQFLISNGLIASLFTNVWGKMDSCKKSASLCILYLSTIMNFFGTFYYYLHSGWCK